MSLERLGFLVVRDRLARTGKEAHEWISVYCYYCKNCRGALLTPDFIMS